MTLERHGCISEFSYEFRRMLASINVQLCRRNVVDAESSAAHGEMEESFTVLEIPDRNCEKGWCSEDILNSFFLHSEWRLDPGNEDYM